MKIYLRTNHFRGAHFTGDFVDLHPADFRWTALAADQTTTVQGFARSRNLLRIEHGMTGPGFSG